MGCFQVHHRDGEKLKSKKRRLLWWNFGFIFPRNSKSSISSSSGSSDSSGDLKFQKLKDLRIFSLAELKAATKNFSSGEKLGEGGFGVVYRGHVKSKKSDEKIEVAVKRLNVKGQQGQKEWLNEVTYLRMVDHPNLVKLLGYCLEHDDRGPQCLLVYELMPNKSLDEHIFQARRPVLPWRHRLQIALGTARGLAYLHEEMKPPIIYRDLKSANILLDNEFKPKLSDFGLARDGPIMGNTHVTTAVVGTAGYAAPEYVQTGHLNAKSDVWTFGMVLLELLTGKKALDMNRPRSERSLADWVKPYGGNDPKKFRKVIDPRLKADISMDEAKAVLWLAQRCIAKNPKQRPKMIEVVRKLEEVTSSSAAVTEQVEKSTETSEPNSRSHSIASMADIIETEVSRSELTAEPLSTTLSLPGTSEFEMESGKSIDRNDAGTSDGSCKINNDTATEGKQTETGIKKEDASAFEKPEAVQEKDDRKSENNETALDTRQQSYTDDLAVEAESDQKTDSFLLQSTVADGDKNDIEVMETVELIASKAAPEEEEEKEEEERRHHGNAPTEDDNSKLDDVDTVNAGPEEETRHHDAVIDGDEERNTTLKHGDFDTAKTAPEEELRRHDVLADGQEEKKATPTEEENSEPGDIDTANAESLHNHPDISPITGSSSELDTEGDADIPEERDTKEESKQQQTPAACRDDADSSQNEARSASPNDDSLNRDRHETDATTVEDAGVAEADHTLVDDSDTRVIAH